jgi:hypothetical protein
MTFEQLATEYVVWEPGTDKAPFHVFSHDNCPGSAQGV